VASQRHTDTVGSLDEGAGKLDNQPESTVNDIRIGGNGGHLPKLVRRIALYAPKCESWHLDEVFSNKVTTVGQRLADESRHLGYLHDAKQAINKFRGRPDS
jgi:hypothetical protein